MGGCDPIGISLIDGAEGHIYIYAINTAKPDRRYAIGDGPSAWSLSHIRINFKTLYLPTSDSDITSEGGHLPLENYAWCLTAPLIVISHRRWTKGAFCAIGACFWEKGKVNEFRGVSFGISNGLSAIGRNSWGLRRDSITLERGLRLGKGKQGPKMIFVYLEEI